MSQRLPHPLRHRAARLAACLVQHTATHSSRIHFCLFCHFTYVGVSSDCVRRVFQAGDNYCVTALVASHQKNTKNTCGDHCQFDWQRFAEPILFTQITVLPSVRPRFIFRRWSADATSNSYIQLRCDVIGSSITCILVTTCILCVHGTGMRTLQPSPARKHAKKRVVGRPSIQCPFRAQKYGKKTRTHLELGGNVECSEQEHEEAHHSFGTYRCPFFPWTQHLEKTGKTRQRSSTHIINVRKRPPGTQHLSKTDGHPPSAGRN